MPDDSPGGHRRRQPREPALQQGAREALVGHPLHDGGVVRHALVVVQVLIPRMQSMSVGKCSRHEGAMRTKTPSCKATPWAVDACSS